MGTIVRRNERSWAIVIISEIKVMLSRLNLKIKSTGGESTLSVNKKSMFPDVLLYEDEAQTKILQGWELKMPDVLITDEALIADATRKAKALGLNSFVIWNFTYGKLYVENSNGDFEEAKVWSGTRHITSRDDVMTYKEEWLPIIKEIVLTVNEYLINGEIVTASISSIISENIMTEVIQRNKNIVAEHLRIEASKNMQMERRLNIWWKAYHEEYDRDENNLYLAYAKNILLNWTNRIAFANTIKKYHNCAYLIKNINDSTDPKGGNIIIDEIIEKGDFFNVLSQTQFNDCIPEDTWIDIVDYNQFLIANKIDCIDQSNLQDILEKTVNVSKREIRGQYATPYKLADILCQITIDNWNKECADFCAGTGTIAKAILNNKKQRVNNKVKGYETTWISDKYAYPLQIANIALASVESVNIPINSFTGDVFDIEVGQEVTMRSPQNGAEFKVQIPAMHAIISNLPFVKYNNNPEETRDFMKKYQNIIFDQTGIKFSEGKTDIYNYIPFKLYELLEKDGKVGMIISNSWLGSETGYQFFKALQFYYEIKSVVISGKGKWFDNADVIATMLVLQKKDIEQPVYIHEISFFKTHKDIRDLTKVEMDSLIDSVVLGEKQNEEIVSCWKYAIAQIDKIVGMGISLNALIHNVEWISKIESYLMPITDAVTMVRGERTGHNKMFYIKGDTSISKDYLVPMLKTSQTIKDLNAKADMTAFCCDKTIEELKAENDEGTLSWIRKFSDENYNPIPTSINYSPWYQMPSLNKADLVMSENPDKRLFIAELKESVLVDQRLIAMKYKNPEFNKDLVFALLNSLYGMFAIEANGFGRGQGVLDISKTRFQKVYMINPEIISKNDASEIIDLFSLIRKRNVKNINEELQCEDRVQFEKKVLSAIGCEEIYNDIKNSILSMQNTRHAL